MFLIERNLLFAEFYDPINENAFWLKDTYYEISKCHPN